MLILKIKILENGYTIRNISKEINISEQTITNWINGRNTSSIVSFLSLCKKLNMTSDEIYKCLSN